MFCVKCGAQLAGNEKFCSKCGMPVKSSKKKDDTYQNSENAVDVNDDRTELLDSNQQTEPMISNIPVVSLPPMNEGFQFQNEKAENAKGKRGGGRKIIVLLVMAAIAVGLTGTIIYMSRFFVSKEKDTLSFSGHLKKAEECVEQGDYEGAIGYYLAALEMEPEEADIYEELSGIYRKAGDNKKAIKILETGYDVTEDKSLKELLGKLYTEFEESDNKNDLVSKENEPSETQESGKAYTGVRTNVNIEVRQVDNTNFPEVVFYANVTDGTGETVKKLDKMDFNIQEIDAQGNVTKAEIQDVYQVLNEDNIKVNLVLDASGSMDEYSKMPQAKNAANAFIKQMELSGGDKVEVISFDDYVYLQQEFTNDMQHLQNAIDSINTGGTTALYDALYAGLFQTYYEEGAKCVIGFTDGMENASSYSFEDVVTMAKNTGIPVFIIGIGDEYDAYALQDLAAQCSGKYYSADVTDLQTILEDIYLSIYREQQDYYVFKYTSQNLENPEQFREILLETSETTEFYGSYRKSYVPQADISGAFSNEYMNKDYIIDFSGQKSVTETDLAGLSLAELRIARNEIFARHGRQFRDVMLNQWFYSKAWYLNIDMKYSPDAFDMIRPSPLSKLEIQNADFIKAYEQNIMDTQDIYPSASNTLLSDYDLALSKAVLRTALGQMQRYASTDVLEQNKRLVQDAINQEEIQY